MNNNELISNFAVLQSIPIQFFKAVRMYKSVMSFSILGCIKKSFECNSRYSHWTMHTGEASGIRCNQEQKIRDQRNGFLNGAVKLFLLGIDLYKPQVESCKRCI